MIKHGISRIPATKLFVKPNQIRMIPPVNMKNRKTERIRRVFSSLAAERVKVSASF